MPRQDVPYGGAICRLKERIAEIWDKLGEKLHSVNGVTGDAAGNVEILSGDAAITISEDQVNHQIEIGLDHAELPSAAVTSVNGQTGAVDLDAGDIPTVGGDVQADLQDLANDISSNAAAINAEALARQGADATLQGNINTLSASIPTAAATAVANDPTVAQLATDVPNKVDKITSGSSLKAYTHTGATQGETSVVDGTAANSIGIRDANGRMQAADPASGATDKTLVTANWVSQTGNSAPNNLFHKTGNETADGVKTFNQRVICAASGGYWTQNATIDWTITPASNNFQFIADSFDKNNVEMFKQVIDDTTNFRAFDTVLPFYDANNVRKEAILRIQINRGNNTATISFYNGSTWQVIA